MPIDRSPVLGSEFGDSVGAQPGRNERVGVAILFLTGARDRLFQAGEMVQEGFGGGRAASVVAREQEPDRGGEAPSALDLRWCVAWQQGDTFDDEHATRIVRGVSNDARADFRSIRRARLTSGDPVEQARALSRSLAARSSGDTGHTQSARDHRCETHVIVIPVTEVEEVPTTPTRFRDQSPWRPFAARIEVLTGALAPQGRPRALAYVPDDESAGQRIARAWHW